MQRSQIAETHSFKTKLFDVVQDTTSEQIFAVTLHGEVFQLKSGFLRQIYSICFGAQPLFVFCENNEVHCVTKTFQLIGYGNTTQLKERAVKKLLQDKLRGFGLSEGENCAAVLSEFTFEDRIC